MIKIGLDTNVIWDTLRYEQDGGKAFDDKKEGDREYFLECVKYSNKILEWPNTELYYTSLTDCKLHKNIGDAWDKFKKRKGLKLMPIPASRADGTHFADGSVLAGGESGFSLTRLYGPEQETKLIKAAEEGNIGAYWDQRKKEGDREMLEAAVLKEVDMVLTHEKKLPKNLRNRSREKDASPWMKKAYEVTKTPKDAYEWLKAKSMVTP